MEIAIAKNKVDNEFLFEQATYDAGCEGYYWMAVSGLETERYGKIYRAQLAIWQVRTDDLQKKFDISTEKGRCGFLAWCLIHGAKEYEALYELEPFWQRLTERAALEISEYSAGISKLVHLWSFGVELHACESITVDEYHKKILKEYWFGGGASSLRKPGKTASRAEEDFLIDSPLIEETTFARLLYEHRVDLQAAFDLSNALGKKDYGRWLRTYGLNETMLGKILSILPTAWPSKSEASKFELKQGVNLIGYAYGQLGIGEDVRMAAKALNAANVPFTIINFNPGPHVGVDDSSVKKWVGEKPIYSINIICLTAIENLRLYLEKGEGLFRGRYNIGYWPWELEFWPKKWEHCSNLVDEIWASSKKVANSLKNLKSVPVHLMPMAVCLPLFESVSCMSGLRNRFGLPHNKSIFVFSFDGGSYIERKNPAGIVKAFSIAFPKVIEDVCLVVKCMRPDIDNESWKAILLAAEKDSRIIIISETLDKEDVLNLYRACHCFVSLHRAEGFGRGIAEALLLGLKVISTDYGGNSDFCITQKSIRIPYELIPVKEWQYTESENNYWAEPDVEVAAKKMVEVHREIARSGYGYTEVSRADQALMHEMFSAEVVGMNYKKRIDHLMFRA